MRRSRFAGRASALVTPAWVGLAVAASGCDGLGFTARCRLGDEHVVQLTTAKEIDAIALVSLGARAFAFWSEPGGAHARALADDAKPVGPVVSVGPRCRGGLTAVAPSAGTLALACLTPAHGELAGGVRVTWLDEGLRALRVVDVARAGAQSEGIDLVAAAGRLELVWHDGSAEQQRVWRAALDGSGAVIDAPQALSDPARVASAPTIGVQAGRAVATWSERFIEGDALRTTVVRWQARTGLQTLLSEAHMAAMPQLVTLGERLVIAVRDRPRDAKIGLYVGFVGEKPVRSSELVRVGRADGVGRPALEPCMGGLVSATPRTYGGDYFIGFNWLDAELRRSRGEQQFYEDSHAFTQVAATCLRTHAVLLIAEFPQLHRDTAALRALPYRCE